MVFSLEPMYTLEKRELDCLGNKEVLKEAIKRDYQNARTLNVEVHLSTPENKKSVIIIVPEKTASRHPH